MRDLFLSVDPVQSDNVGQPRAVFEDQFDVRRVFPILDVVLTEVNRAVKRRDRIAFVFQYARKLFTLSVVVVFLFDISVFESIRFGSMKQCLTVVE